MKLGFGLYRHMLNEQHYKFAKQCGATHLVIHLVDYFGHNKDSADQPIGGVEGWGKAGNPNEIWSLEFPSTNGIDAVHLGWQIDDAPNVYSSWSTSMTGFMSQTAHLPNGRIQDSASVLLAQQNP